jgi:polyribonucleotide 5'-hydroxyl-kinase
MAKKIEERLQNDPDTNASGVIIDTCAWSDFSDLEIILHAAKAFDVDVILATDDRLYSSLRPSFESSPVVVARIPRSGGIVTQDAASRRRKRKAQIDEYFYGRKESPSDPNLLSPARVTIRLSQYNFWQMGGVQLHEGIKSHGVSTTSDPTQFSALVPSRDLLLHAVVAVLHRDGSFGGPDASNAAAGSGDSEGKPAVNVAAGFVYFVEVEVDKDTAVILAPTAGPLPSKHLVVGSIKWFE